MAASWFVSLFALLGGFAGGGSDLVDYLPAEAYWKAKGVAVTVEAMSAELRPPRPADVAQALRDMASGDAAVRERGSEQARAAGAGAIPALQRAAEGDGAEVSRRARAVLSEIAAQQRATAVRRLMAIRALGELRGREAIPTLTALAASAAPFEAEYARAALGAIEGKPFQRERAPKVADDVWLLPAGCGAVAQVAARAGGPVPFSLDAALRAALPVPPAGAAAAADEAHLPTAEEVADEVLTQVLPIAEQLGNVRLDAVTVGVSEEIGDRAGFVVAIARGRYDAAALAGLLAANKVPFVTVDGVQVWKPTLEVALFLPSDDRLVFIAAPRGNDGPVAETVAAVKAGAGKLRASAEIVALLKSVDNAAPAWAVVRMTDAYRVAPPLAAFDSATFSATPRAGGTAVDLRLVARGADPAKVKATVDDLTRQLDDGRAKVRQALGEQGRRWPNLAARLRFAGEFVESIRLAADGAGVATAQATLDASPANLLNVVFMAFGQRSVGPDRAEPVQPPAR